MLALRLTSASGGVRGAAHPRAGASRPGCRSPCGSRACGSRCR